MKKLVAFFKKCKKGFTLMECVCAIAIVSIISALILPLTAGAIKSVRAAESLRTQANNAAKNLSETKTDKDHKQKMYVKVDYNVSQNNEDVKSLVKNLGAQSVFVFSKASAQDTQYQVEVTYYELKYGKEEEDPS